MPYSFLSLYPHVRSGWYSLILVGGMLILGGACIGGCVSDGPENGSMGSTASVKGPPAVPFEADREGEPPEKVDIVVDATLSMKGFTASSAYKTLVAQSLSNAAPGGATVRYRQLSTAFSEGIRDVEDKMRAVEGSFYTNGGDTRLQTAIDSARANRLTVIVTDLFQTSGDMNAVSQSLTEYVLQDRKAVGLFGVRFPFEGRVFDLGFEERSFSFSGERPVYGLVLGTPSQISAYFEDLRTFVSATDYHYLLIGTHVSRKSAEIGSINSRKNLVEVSPKGTARLPQQRTLSVRVRNNNQKSSLRAKLRTFLFEEAAPLVQTGKIRTDVSEVWKFNSDQEEYIRSFSDSSGAREALIGEVLSNQGQQDLRLELRPQDIRRGDYCFNLTMRIAQWTLPKWVSDWNLPPSQFQSKEPDGSKTANLKPFLLDLSSNITQSTSLQLGTLQVFVQKRR